MGEKSSEDLMGEDPRKIEPGFPRMAETSAMPKEGSALKDPVEDWRDRAKRRILFHAWAHLPQRVAGEPPRKKEQVPLQ